MYTKKPSDIQSQSMWQTEKDMVSCVKEQLQQQQQQQQITGRAEATVMAKM